jgi:mono/diheme cytochrome c family protein
MKFIAGIIFTVLILIVGGLITMYSGWINISAANEVSGAEEWFFGTTMDNSVEKHSEGISVPYLSSKEKILEGFEHYNKMCVNCHGAPGKPETELAKGLNPPAPDLSESAKDMTPQELFWVTKNGVKMTGMPAWGKTHSDEKIWNIVAFIEKLPGMTAAHYDSLETSSNHSEKEEHENRFN